TVTTAPSTCAAPASTRRPSPSRIRTPPSSTDTGSLNRSVTWAGLSSRTLPWGGSTDSSDAWAAAGPAPATSATSAARVAASAAVSPARAARATGARRGVGGTAEQRGRWATGRLCRAPAGRAQRRRPGVAGLPGHQPKQPEPGRLEEVVCLAERGGGAVDHVGDGGDRGDDHERRGARQQAPGPSRLPGRHDEAHGEGHVERAELPGHVHGGAVTAEEEVRHGEDELGEGDGEQRPASGADRPRPRRGHPRVRRRL